MISCWLLCDKRFPRYRCSKFENIFRKYGFAKIVVHSRLFFKVKQFFKDNAVKAWFVEEDHSFPAISFWSLCDKRFPRYWHSKFENIFRKYEFAKIAAHSRPFFKVKQSLTDNKDILLIAVRQAVPEITALKLCLYFLKIGAKNFFSWEKGYLNFSIRGSLSIIEAQYPSNVIAR